ncbi:MAG: hypothetical protein AVDCRST_MAG13-2579 [uncultured Solirubrobacteraceae bacterium]|uniref:Uncharacterized protein n=1 Tax=uncultured Solirubrobacteraceae bacterium TaxID=1162706 RepID=A0A6J4SVP7_9ACTN|nr:MAG: hypothetical protein AVDCRST_MAG13-2579 [uncultured Solirubrobacteraceae bacterium]
MATTWGLVAVAAILGGATALLLVCLLLFQLSRTWRRRRARADRKAADRR